MTVMPFLLGIFAASLPLILGESLNRFLGMEKEYARKLIHVLASIAAISLTFFLGLDQIAIIGATFFVVLLAVRKYKITPTLYEIKRHSYGELMFPLGVLSAALLAKDTGSFIAIMLVVGLSDTAASIIGQNYGKHPISIFWIKKSFEGSAMFFAVTMVILFIFSNLPLLSVLIFAVVAALTELFSSRGTDNLTVPVIMALLWQTI